MSASAGEFAGRVAVVTGGSRGIGAATALALAGRGATLAVIARDRTALDGVAERIATRGSRAIAVPADCTDSDAVNCAFDAIATDLLSRGKRSRR